MLNAVLGLLKPTQVEHDPLAEHKKLMKIAVLEVDNHSSKKALDRLASLFSHTSLVSELLGHFERYTHNQVQIITSQSNKYSRY
jgi:hypothetical protein